MTSGGFDPLHIGHTRLFNEAKKLGDKLFVVINGDGWVKRKKGRVFMSAIEKAELISNFSAVDYVVIWDDGENHIGGAIKFYQPSIMAKGGDRASCADLPIEEVQACAEVGTKIVFNVGGGKVQASSDLLGYYCKKKK